MTSMLHMVMPRSALVALVPEDTDTDTDMELQYFAIRNPMDKRKECGERLGDWGV